MDKEIQIQIPKNSERLQILSLYLENIKNNLNKNEIEDINFQMNGFSPADVVNLLREAVMLSSEKQGGEGEEESKDNALEKK